MTTLTLPRKHHLAAGIVHRVLVAASRRVQVIRDRIRVRRRLGLGLKVVTGACWRLQWDRRARLRRWGPLLDSRHPLLGDRHTLLDSMQPLLDSRHALLGDRHPLLGDRHALLDSMHHLLDSRHALLGDRITLLEGG